MNERKASGSPASGSVDVLSCSGARWYAQADLVPLDEWEQEQDPELYRALAGPRAALPGAMAPIVALPADEEVEEAWEEMDTLLPEDELEVDHSGMICELPSATVVAVMDDDEEAGDDPGWVGAVVLELRQAPRWLRNLEEVHPAVIATPRRPSPMLVPAYELQCGFVPPDPDERGAHGRRLTARVARRLWQRDMERIAS